MQSDQILPNMPITVCSTALKLLGHVYLCLALCTWFYGPECFLSIDVKSQPGPTALNRSAALKYANLHRKSRRNRRPQLGAEIGGECAQQGLALSPA